MTEKRLFRRTLTANLRVLFLLLISVFFVSCNKEKEDKVNCDTILISSIETPTETTNYVFNNEKHLISKTHIWSNGDIRSDTYIYNSENQIIQTDINLNGDLFVYYNYYNTLGLVDSAILTFSYSNDTTVYYYEYNANNLLLSSSFYDNRVFIYKDSIVRNSENLISIIKRIQNNNTYNEFEYEYDENDNVIYSKQRMGNTGVFFIQYFEYDKKINPESKIFGFYPEIDYWSRPHYNNITKELSVNQEVVFSYEYEYNECAYPISRNCNEEDCNTTYKYSYD